MELIDTNESSSAVAQGCDPDPLRQHPYRPMPDPRTGELKIDPDILLKARKFNLAISFFYSSQSDLNAEYGRGRAASVRGQVISATSGRSVTVVRGDFRQYPFSLMGTSGGITTYTAVGARQTMTTLSFNGTTFTEYFNDGMQLLYQAQVGGASAVTY